AKRRMLEKDGVMKRSVEFMLNGRNVRRSMAAYAPIQERYIQWATENGLDGGVPLPFALLEWLIVGVVSRGWKPGTALNYKGAMVQLYQDQTTFQNPSFLAGLDAIRKHEVRDKQELDLDLTPVVEFFESLPPNDDMDMTTLTRKLCWLLG
ncbi:hypothetical protein BGW38_009261, partial [Lunasporangiospora selenospora]